MSRVKGKDTTPERLVRSALHAKGQRFRLHARDLPGRPDIVFRGDKVAVFVHGCFWHRHEGCPNCRTPKSRVDFWQSKFAANISRDEAALKKLQDIGWTAIVIWECQARSDTALDKAIEIISKARDTRRSRA